MQVIAHYMPNTYIECLPVDNTMLITLEKSLSGALAHTGDKNIVKTAIF